MENSGLLILQVIIIIISIIIVGFIYSESSKTSSLQTKMDNFKCPTCPKCPDIPPCECEAEGCPACVCEKHAPCPKCPKAPGCPKQKSISVKDILDGIFPGRHQGLTVNGEYHPIGDLSKSQGIEPAWSQVKDLVPNYTSKDGTPAAVSFSDSMKGSHSKKQGKASLPLGKTKDKEITKKSGIFKDTGSAKGSAK